MLRRALLHIMELPHPALAESAPLLSPAAPAPPRYVGASEENIRNLFKEAEVDYAKLGEASGACRCCALVEMV